MRTNTLVSVNKRMVFYQSETESCRFLLYRGK